MASCSVYTLKAGTLWKSSGVGQKCWNSGDGVEIGCSHFLTSDRMLSRLERGTKHLQTCNQRSQVHKVQILYSGTKIGGGIFHGSLCRSPEMGVQCTLLTTYWHWFEPLLRIKKLKIVCIVSDASLSISFHPAIPEWEQRGRSTCSGNSLAEFQTRSSWNRSTAFHSIPWHRSCSGSRAPEKLDKIQRSSWVSQLEFKLRECQSPRHDAAFKHMWNQ